MNRPAEFRLSLGQVLVVLCALAALVAGAASYAAGAARDEASVGRDAQEAAEALAPRLLSYDHTRMKADRAALLALTTGSFREEYADLLDERLAPAAEASGTVTTATVDRTATVRAPRPGEVVVLLVMTRTTSTADAPQSVTTPLQAEVTVRRGDDGVWKVAALEPL